MNKIITNVMRNVPEFLAGEITKCHRINATSMEHIEMKKYLTMEWCTSFEYTPVCSCSISE